jgi:hypothetical protein
MGVIIPKKRQSAALIYLEACQLEGEGGKDGLNQDLTNFEEHAK